MSKLNRHHEISGLALVIALSGCATPQAFDTSSPFYNPPVGTRFTLHQPLPLPAETYTAYFQYGQWNIHSFNRFEPHCQLDAKGVNDGGLVIEPGRYEVERVIYKTPIHVKQAPTLLAALGTARIGTLNDGPSEVISVVELRFRQHEGSNAWRLTCGGAQALPAEALAPSIDEIRTALGSVASLTLPEDN